VIRKRLPDLCALLETTLRTRDTFNLGLRVTPFREPKAETITGVLGWQVLVLNDDYQDDGSSIPNTGHEMQKTTHALLLRLRRLLYGTLDFLHFTCDPRRFLCARGPGL
jgi:hypothetical protein